MAGPQRRFGMVAGAQGSQAQAVERRLHEAEAGTRKWLRKHGFDKPERRIDPIAIRPMTIDDASYVIDSWSNSYRRSPTTGMIEREVFNIEQRARIDRIVSYPHSRIFIACDAAVTREIRGWVCFEPPSDKQQLPIVHYVCVHPHYQLAGIGSALVNIARQTATDPEQPMWSTHETQPMRHVRPKWNLLFNPYLLEVPARVHAVRATGAATNTWIPDEVFQTLTYP